MDTNGVVCDLLGFLGADWSIQGSANYHDHDRLSRTCAQMRRDRGQNHFRIYIFASHSRYCTTFGLSLKGGRGEKRNQSTSTLSRMVRPNPYLSNSGLTLAWPPFRPTRSDQTYRHTRKIKNKKNNQRILAKRETAVRVEVCTPVITPPFSFWFTLVCALTI